MVCDWMAYRAFCMRKNDKPKEEAVAKKWCVSK